MTTSLDHLIKKYQGNVPRYTSYPTPDRWSNASNAKFYEAKLSSLREKRDAVSLYIHIPFCQKLCYYCACNTLIRSRKQAPTNDYLDHLEKEFEIITEMSGGPLRINQLHLGGGTPTFLMVPQIERLLECCHKYFDFSTFSESSFETDPSTCTKEQISLFHELGFRRISFGVQDFDPEVLEAVNRDNSPECIQDLVSFSRQQGYRSVNLDFIYGLPCQTLETALNTVDRISEIRPDRIALYNFAYLPEVKKHHLLLPKDRLPTPQEKAEVFMAVSERLTHYGYQPIGMDHFALPGDELSYATRNGTLARNFMGYTTKKAPHVLGTGLTGISFLDNYYFQNSANLHHYRDLLDDDQPPIVRSCELSYQDICCKYLIDELMCNLRIDPQAFQKIFGQTLNTFLPNIDTHLSECLDDQLLIKQTDNSTPLYTVTSTGRLFLRSIARGLDAYLESETADTQMFSKAV